MDSLKGEQGWFPTPAYDSGWIGPLPASASREIQIYHGLNTTNVLVYLTANMASDWLLIHQRWFGGDGGRGMWWFNGTANSLTVWVQNGYPPEFEYVRVQIWRARAEP